MPHFCIANPCWICHPHYKSEEKPASNALTYSVQFGNGISELVKEQLISIFMDGLYEDIYIREMDNSLTIDQIKEDRKLVQDNSLEAILMDRLIEDYLLKINK